jgi:hypothetical protein
MSLLCRSSSLSVDAVVLLVPAVHLAHATFNWAHEASTVHEPRTRVKSMNSGWESEAVRDAFNKDRRSTRDHKGTAAVNDGKTLFPSKIKELGGTPAPAPTEH